MKLKDLVGIHCLSGVDLSVINDSGYDCNCVKFTLDGVTYCAVEDPDDGYRSYCGELVVSDSSCRFQFPALQVLCTMQFEGLWGDDVLLFTDVITGKEVLAVGTEDLNDYYPVCVMRYTPENMAHNKKE